MTIVHRKEQRHGPGITSHPRERTCKSCEQVFKSKLGLKNHQSRRGFPGCYRAGILRKRAELIQDHNLHYDSWKSRGLIPGDHRSVYLRHSSGIYILNTI